MSAAGAAEAELDEAAAGLARLGPEASATVRRTEMLLAIFRDGEVELRLHGRSGSAVEVVGDAREMFFAPAATAGAVHGLLRTAAGDRPAGARSAARAAAARSEVRAAEVRAAVVRAAAVRAAGPAVGGPPGLPPDVLAAVPALVAGLAEGMTSGQPPGLVPMIVLQATREVVAVRHGDGRVAGDDRLHLEFRIGARAAADPAARSLRVLSGRTLELLTAGDRHRAAAAEVLREAADRVGAVAAPEGELPVVLAPGGPAALLHEVCGHGLEVDVATAPGAAYGGPLGRRIASPLVTLVDDPTAPAHAPLYRVDDEGCAAGPVVLVDRGVLASYLVDAEGARRTGHRPTGHGRRLDHAHPALARMACTYLAAGDSPPAEALAGVRRGLYVRSVVAGETDLSGGSFGARVTESRLIENGRVTAPVRAARLAGTGTAVLRDVDVVGDDLEFYAYGFQCNKLSQFPLTVSVGQPTVRVRRMWVGA